MTDLAVVGGGIIGLAIAWRAARAGHSVTVIDPAPGSGASTAAAGVLAPVTGPGDAAVELRALSLAAAAAYPGFVGSLTEASGVPVHLRRTGTLVVTLDPAAEGALDDLAALLATSGVPAERLAPAEAARLEPGLATPVTAALLRPDDHEVDARQLTVVLRLACGRAGVVVVAQHATGVEVRGDRVRGVVLRDGSVVASRHVVLACGTARLEGVPPGVVPRVRPVKGEVVHLRGPASPPVVRHIVQGLGSGPAFIVPRGDGRYVLGSSEYEGDDDPGVTAGGVADVIDAARVLVPRVAGLTFVEATAGLRPAAPDGLPLIGPTSLDGLLAALGHFRKGILLAPATADAVVAALHGEPSPLAAPFDPRRFALSGRS